MTRNETIDSAKIKRPKYVFFFIGDGMGPVQYQLTSNYLYRISDPEVIYLRPQKMLNFMYFPTVATVMTPDSTSFVPDSASTATAMSSGEKTHTMSVNTDEVGDRKYRPLSYDLHDLGYRLGVVTTAFMNDATPASFYSQHYDRYDRYPIASQMSLNGVDVYAGGGIMEPDDPKGIGEDSWELLKQAGYTIVNTRKDALNLSAKDLPAYILGEDLDHVQSVPYAIDRDENSWNLGQYLRRTVELLDQDDEKGFFILCEAGKIDWACHNNTCGTMIHEVIDLTTGVDVALEFQKKHPDETLILVTADHETGGLSQGFTSTHYMTYIENYQAHKVSHDYFRINLISRFVKEQTPFEEAMKSVEECFGLYPPQSDELPEPGSLELTPAEYERIREGYELTIHDTFHKRRPTQFEYETYGGYNPFQVAIQRVFNRKCGVDFSTFGHTATPVSLFSQGPGSELFTGLIDNTEIYLKLRSLLTNKS